MKCWIGESEGDFLLQITPETIEEAAICLRLGASATKRLEAVASVMSKSMVLELSTGKNTSKLRYGTLRIGGTP